MANRPVDFDITTPTATSSPRTGDDELRKIKQYTQNAYNDLHSSTGVGVEHQHTYHTNITASGSISMGGTEITATSAELNKLDGVTATTAEINKLDIAENTFLGILAIEEDSSNVDPVAGDFTGNITIIGQY